MNTSIYKREQYHLEHLTVRDFYIINMEFKHIGYNLYNEDQTNILWEDHKQNKTEYAYTNFACPVFLSHTSLLCYQSYRVGFMKHFPLSSYSSLPF